MVRTPSHSPTRGARSRKAGSMRCTQRSGGSIWWQSVSITSRPLRMGALLSEVPCYRVAEFGGSGRAALVGREVPAVGVDAGDGGLDAAGGVGELQVVEHHHGRQDGGGGVDDVLARDVRSGAVGGFEVGVVVAVAAAGGEAQAADDAGRGVGEDVAVEVRQDDDVEGVGVGDDSPREVVGEEALEGDVGVGGGDVGGDAAEEAVALGEHVVLGGAGDLAGSASLLAAAGELEGEADDACGAGLGDDLQGESAGSQVGDRGAECSAGQVRGTERVEVAFDTDVEVFEVLADDGEVDAVGIGERAAEAGEPAGGANVGVGRLAPAEVEESPGARAAGRAEERRRGVVDGAAGCGVVVDRWAHPVEVEAKAVEEGDGRANSLGGGVLAVDDYDARHRRRAARYAGSVWRSDSSTVIPSGPRRNTSLRPWKSSTSVRAAIPAARSRPSSLSRSSTAKHTWLNPTVLRSSMVGFSTGSGARYASNWTSARGIAPARTSVTSSAAIPGSPMDAEKTSPEMTTERSCWKPSRAKNRLANSTSRTTSVMWSKCLTIASVSRVGDSYASSPGQAILVVWRGPRLTTASPA